MFVDNSRIFLKICIIILFDSLAIFPLEQKTNNSVSKKIKIITQYEDERYKFEAVRYMGFGDRGSKFHNYSKDDFFFPPFPNMSLYKIIQIIRNSEILIADIRFNELWSAEFEGIEIPKFFIENAKEPISQEEFLLNYFAFDKKNQHVFLSLDMLVDDRMPQTEIYLFNLKSSKISCVGVAGDISNVYFSPSGKYLLVEEKHEDKSHQIQVFNIQLNNSNYQKFIDLDPIFDKTSKRNKNDKLVFNWISEDLVKITTVPEPKKWISADGGIVITREIEQQKGQLVDLSSVWPKIK
jgi:hypothetical protein